MKVSDDVDSMEVEYLAPRASTPSAHDRPATHQLRSPQPATNPDRYLHGLTNADAFTLPAEVYQETYYFWVSLLQATILPSDISYSDPRLGHALQVIEDILTNGQYSHIFARFAYVHLSAVLDSLQCAIKNDRLSGKLPGKSGEGDASVAINIHEKSISTIERGNIRSRITRRDVKMRRRIAKRWKLLTEGSPFLLLAYSNRAEKIMYVRSY